MLCVFHCECTINKRDLFGFGKLIPNCGMDLKETLADYGTKCGELYFSDLGDVTFHCVICTNQYDEFLKYYEHLITSHTTNKCEYLTEEQQDYEVEYNANDYEYVDKEKSNAFDAKLDESVLEENEVDITLFNIYPDCDEKTMPEWKTSGKDLIQAHPTKGDGMCVRVSRQLGRIRSKDENIIRKYRCTECDFSCKDKSNLTGHMKRHSESKAFLCNICEKDFHTSTELKAHFRRHTGEKPFLCTDCGRAFFTSGQLSAHVKRHKNQRDKECHMCHKKFFDAVSLENHLRVHTGYRPFKCTFPECNSMGFKRRNALDGHRKMHENKREYQCSYCPARFNQKCNLNSHNKSKHMIA